MAHIIAHRKLTHERYRKVIEAPESDSLTPALRLAESIRELSAPQHVVLDHLLRVFSEMPKLRSEASIMAVLRIRLHEEG